MQFFTQNYLWLVLIFYYYTTWFTDGVVGDYSGILLAVVLFYIRASVIGVKYACYGEKNWNRVKTQEIPNKEIFGNLTLVKWLKDIKNQIIYEVLASEIRCDCYNYK